jgi:hypothetical protein|tara:strand:- start:535 stop:864 length:330 start_codon:yes stop_codon:yes gene_type:complete
MINKQQFEDHLTNIKYASKYQQRKELWDLEGILINKTNRIYKFDLRPIKNNIKKGSFKTKADKMVFSFKDKWIIVDIEELHEYLQKSHIVKIKLDDIISNLYWNIELKK